MQQVKVKTAELLKRIEANREKHRETFEKALGGYRTRAIDELDRMLADARAGKRIRQAVGLVEPTDQTAEYDRVIEMLKMSVDIEVELSASEFANYVMDRWNWSAQFTSTTSQYL